MVGPVISNIILLSALAIMVKLILSLDKRIYFPADEVLGTLTLQTKKPINLGVLVIKIHKKQRLEIRSEAPESMLVTTSPSPHSIYEHRFELLSNAELGSGEHVFPFRYLIKPREGSSGRLSSSFAELNCSFENTYLVSAICNYDDNESASAETAVQICNKELAPRCVDMQIKTESFFGLKRSVHFYRLETDRSLYSTGDVVHIKSFPQSLCTKRIIREMKASIYEIFSYNSETVQITRSRLIDEVPATEVQKNVFSAEIKIPSNIFGTVSEQALSIRIVLICTYVLKKGKPIKVTKYIDVNKPLMTIPGINETFGLEGIKYNEAILKY